MPEYVIRILRSVAVLEKTEEHVIQADSLGEAKREALGMLMEKYPMDQNVESDTKEKVSDPIVKADSKKKGMPF
jgi:predicted RNA-binding protein